MPIDAESLPNAESTLAVPGVLCVTPLASGGNLVHVGPSAGWMVPRGLLRWEREISFIARTDMTAELGRTLHATLPHEQVPPKKLPLVYRAVESSPFLALTRKLAAEARKHVRVHTVGVDRVSAGFFYFAEGGTGDAVRAQGNLVEMLAASLKPSSTNAEIASLQDGLVDRLLAFFSEGLVSEHAAELVDALPRMASDGTGLVGTQLEVFELQARALSSRSARWESSAREMAEALQGATARGDRTTRVPLYGEARQQMLRPLKIQMGADTFTLPARYRWTVIGQPREELKAPERPAAGQQPAQPTPSPPRTGPAVPRPEPTTGMRRLPTAASPQPASVTAKGPAIDAQPKEDAKPAPAAAPAEAAVTPEATNGAHRPAKARAAEETASAPLEKETAPEKVEPRAQAAAAIDGKAEAAGTEGETEPTSAKSAASTPAPAPPRPAPPIGPRRESSSFCWCSRSVWRSTCAGTRRSPVSCSSTPTANDTSSALRERHGVGPGLPRPGRRRCNRGRSDGSSPRSPTDVGDGRFRRQLRGGLGGRAAFVGDRTGLARGRRRRGLGDAAPPDRPSLERPARRAARSRRVRLGVRSARQHEGRDQGRRPPGTRRHGEREDQSAEPRRVVLHRAIDARPAVGREPQDRSRHRALLNASPALDTAVGPR